MDSKTFKAALKNTSTTQDSIAPLFVFAAQEAWKNGDATRANQLLGMLEHRKARHKRAVASALLQVMPFRMTPSLVFAKKDRRRAEAIKNKWKIVESTPWHKILSTEPLPKVTTSSTQPKKSRYEKLDKETREEIEWRRRRMPGSAYSRFR